MNSFCGNVSLCHRDCCKAYQIEDSLRSKGEVHGMSEPVARKGCDGLFAVLLSWDGQDACAPFLLCSLWSFCYLLKSAHLTPTTWVRTVITKQIVGATLLVGRSSLWTPACCPAFGQVAESCVAVRYEIIVRQNRLFCQKGKVKLKLFK